MRISETFNYSYLPVILMLMLLQNCNPSKGSGSEEKKSEAEFYTLEDFGSVKKYDVHVPLRKEFDTLFIKQAEADNFGLLNLSVFTFNGTPPEKQEAFSFHLKEEFPERIDFATAFSLENYNTEAWAVSYTHLTLPTILRV